MKSIYSLGALQRILDHWGVGKIVKYTYFDTVGRNIWRHWLETNQGIFELYSYVPEESQYAEQKLLEYFHSSRGLENPKRQHCFDRYHVLVQFTRKVLVTATQVRTDLDLLIGQSLLNAFRVYGALIQFDLEQSTLVANGWSIQKLVVGEQRVLVHSSMNSLEQLDAEIEKLVAAHPKVQKYVLKQEWFELFLVGDISIHFSGSNSSEAISVNNQLSNHHVRIFTEKMIWYQWDFE